MIAYTRPRRSCPAGNRHMLDDQSGLFIPGVSLGRTTPHDGGQLDYVRCPLCRGPLTARLGGRGPYFHCLCLYAGTGR